MTDTTLARPPFDPELEAALALVGDQMPSTLTAEMIPLLRQSSVGGEEEIVPLPPANRTATTVRSGFAPGLIALRCGYGSREDGADPLPL